MWDARHEISGWDKIEIPESPKYFAAGEARDNRRYGEVVHWN
jgi:hypothetical protein